MSFFNIFRSENNRANSAQEIERRKVIDALLEEVQGIEVNDWKGRQIRNSHVVWIKFVRENTKLQASSLPKQFDSSFEHLSFVERIVKEVGKVFANNTTYKGCMVLPAELFPYPISFIVKCFDHAIEHRIFEEPEGTEALETLRVSLNYVLDRPISEVSNDPRQNVELISECKTL